MLDSVACNAENAIQSHCHGLKLFKVIKKFWICYSGSSRIYFWKGTAFLYCSVSDHLSQDFQDGLAFLLLLLWDHCPYMSLPSLMYRPGTIYLLFHPITLSPWIFLSLYADLHKIWQIVSSMLNYSIASLISQSWPKKIIFYHFLQALFGIISTGLHRIIGPAQILEKASMQGSSVKRSNPTDSLLSTEKRARIWGQPRETTVGALCLPGSLAAAWAGRFQIPGVFLCGIWDHVLCNDNTPLLRKWKAWGQWSDHCIWVGQSQKVGVGQVIFWEHKILELLKTALNLWICASQTHPERLTHMANLITPIGLSPGTSMLWDVMHLPNSYLN